MPSYKIWMLCTSARSKAMSIAFMSVLDSQSEQAFDSSIQRRRSPRSICIWLIRETRSFFLRPFASAMHVTSIKMCSWVYSGCVSAQRLSSSPQGM